MVRTTSSGRLSSGGEGPTPPPPGSVISTARSAPPAPQRPPPACPHTAQLLLLLLLACRGCQIYGSEILHHLFSQPMTQQVRGGTARPPWAPRAFTATHNPCLLTCLRIGNLAVWVPGARLFLRGDAQPQRAGGVRAALHGRVRQAHAARTVPHVRTYRRRHTSCLLAVGAHLPGRCCCCRPDGHWYCWWWWWCAAGTTGWWAPRTSPSSARATSGHGVAG